MGLLSSSLLWKLLWLLLYELISKCLGKKTRIFGTERPNHLEALKIVTFSHHIPMIVDGKNYYASFVITVCIKYLKTDLSKRWVPTVIHICHQNIFTWHAIFFNCTTQRSGCHVHSAYMQIFILLWLPHAKLMCYGGIFPKKNEDKSIL